MNEEDVKKIRLQDCPTEHKKWKTLSEYRMEISPLINNLTSNFFDYYNIVEKIAEQLMALDYLISLELWLIPFSTIGKRHKSIFIQQLCSVYESLLELFVNNQINQVKNLYPIINNETLNNKFNTLGILVKKIDKTNIFNAKQVKYLKDLAEYRNLIHLSKKETNEIIEWFNQQSTKDLREQLDKFVTFMEKNIKNDD